MRSTSSSRLVPLGIICFLVLFHGSLAQQSCKPLQSPRLRGRSDCQFQKITAREPNRYQVSEAGFSEFWDSGDQDELECAGVEVVRHTINAKGLLLPYYPSTPELVYVVRGQGIQGTVLPGCDETFETTFTSEGGSGQFSDKHQKVYRYKEGDILALPAGAVHWTYNDGDKPTIVVALRDTSNAANQLDRTFRKFFLAGNPQSQVQQGEPWGRPDQPGWEKFRPGQPGSAEFRPGQPGRPKFRPGQPGSAEFRPGQPGSAEFRPGQPGSVEFRPGQPGYEKFQPRQQGSEKFQPGQPGSEKFRPGQPGSTKFRPGQPGSAEFRPGQPGSAEFRPGKPGSAEFRPGKPGSAEKFRPDQPGSAEFRPGQPGSSEFRPGKPGSAEFRPDQPGWEKFRPGQPGSAEFRPGQPGSGKFRPGQPGSVEKFRPGQPGWEKFRPGQPGSAEFRPEQPGSAEFRPGKPGSETFRPGQPGSERFRPGQPGFEKFQPGQPRFEKFQPSQPGWQTFQPGQPGWEKFQPDQPKWMTGRQGQVFEDPCAICRQIRGGRDEPCAKCNEVGTQFEGEGFNIFTGFDDEILQELFDVENEIVRQLKGLFDDRGLIVLAKNFHVLIPEEQQQYSPQRGVDNGIEQTICSTQLSANIGKPAFADVYNPRGGRISSLNSHKLPVLESFQLSAERGLLYKNAVLAPHYNLNAHSIIYITSGSSRLQIVRNDGSRVFDDVVTEGQLIVVPQDFAVIKKAGEEGCEWVAFKTNDNAITTQLAGRFSYIRALPEEVLVNAYSISRQEAKSLKYNQKEGVVLSPHSTSPIKKAKNVMLNALFG